MKNKMRKSILQRLMSDDNPIVWGCVVQIIILAVIASCWIVNFVKFTKCDFKEPYKYEVIHVVGLVPGFSVVTCWFPSEEK